MECRKNDLPIQCCSRCCHHLISSIASEVRATVQPVFARPCPKLNLVLTGCFCTKVLLIKRASLDQAEFCHYHDGFRCSKGVRLGQGLLYLVVRLLIPAATRPETLCKLTARHNPTCCRGELHHKVLEAVLRKRGALDCGSNIEIRSKSVC